MPDYEVTVEVEGVVHVTVEAADVDDAYRKARHAAERGEGIPNLSYEPVAVRWEERS